MAGDEKVVEKLEVEEKKGDEEEVVTKEDEAPKEDAEKKRTEAALASISLRP
eukprot:CAMPEP_0119135902 /NCGR_PEP_ID=MMETSP1310-20130426/20298_1 /TAXON_ID=464262 /ORGANISM="Genus nov. species nov., Strain RCC2339" /LENGTH=51 /DNA_ID=CAMNT_0007126847 /DNA_START=32 /DNA_END=183 /DNA_ORIENTATION=+